ncbi:unnamed protein product [Penicillium camemberti]|uniref:Str. FM013 n=1 Tax=Penicillium camemberti (strain FM 013) TaxID=1429867 RepID=A0A0G4PU66_PENC3|nr:unnamed protein product [Penicillium camemberti]
MLALLIGLGQGKAFDVVQGTPPEEAPSRHCLELRTSRVIGGEQTRLCFYANKLAV